MKMIIMTKSSLEIEVQDSSRLVPGTNISHLHPQSFTVLESFIGLLAQPMLAVRIINTYPIACDKLNSANNIFLFDFKSLSFGVRFTIKRTIHAQIVKHINTTQQ